MVARHFEFMALRTIYYILCRIRNEVEEAEDSKSIVVQAFQVKIKQVQT
jgi:hypothetical protein